ncbi:MAG: dTDP-4-dehydrorhamnose reductase [Gemmatimonadota bacterium]|nr:dTDP-4-dehydrorhamnose reductase [Gemmatimonadota bacterium]
MSAERGGESASQATVRVAATGCAGMLGRELGAEAAARGVPFTGWDLPDFDLTDREAVMREIGSARPDVVIHAAAWTDVDACESNPSKAFLVNGRATAHVVEACREAGARVVHVSTDYVFPGDLDRPYREDDLPGPLSVYGWSKLAGEEAVRSLGDAGAIARTAWLYAGHGANFLRTMLRLGRERDSLAVVDDQLGSPTFAGDLARVLLDLAIEGGSGTFHTTNTGSVTWHGFASAIFAAAGIGVEVKAVTSADFPRPAHRPANSVLLDSRLADAGIHPMPSWEDGLARCFAGMAKEGAA